MTQAVVLFCGAGGATLGIHDAGYDTVGIDWWEPACRTHAAAGYPTIRADLNGYPWRLIGGLDLLWSSPPCQDWSMAGKGAGADGGRNGWPATLAAVDVLRPRLFIAENVAGMLNRQHRPYVEWICQQLRDLGYDARYCLLVSSDFGSPQSRKRLQIVARRDGTPVWPLATHAAYRPRHHREGDQQPELFAEPWVPASSILGDVDIDRRQTGAAVVPSTSPAPTVTAGAFGKSIWLAVETQQTSETADGRVRYQRSADQPAPVVCGHRVPRWVYDRPATSVLGDPRVSVPGHHDPTVGNSQHDGTRWGIAEAAALQGFPPDWPWHGTKTEIHTQIGNAVIPLMAQRLVEVNR